MTTQRSARQPVVSLRPEPMKARIAEILRVKIVSGEYALGEQLSEKTISAELGVSRTPIREALLLLERNGLLVIKPQSGTYVFNPSRVDTMHLCTMRSILEIAAIKLAADFQDELVLKRLAEIIKDSNELLEEGSYEDCHWLDTDFHVTLIEASGNPFLIDSYKIIADRSHALRQLLPLTRKRISRAIKEHKQILQAVRTKNLTRAEELLTNHVGNVEAMLLEHTPET